MSAELKLEHRWRRYAIMSSARNAVGIKAYFGYWQGPEGGPYRKLFGPLLSFQVSLDFIHKHQESETMREIKEDLNYPWGASHEAIRFLENQGFEMTMLGGWKLPKPGYQLDHKEKSAVEYLIKDHQFKGVERL
jgi:hypothetical protein